MWDRKQVKQQGKTKFKGNYWRSVLAAFLISVLTGASSIAGRFSIPGLEEPEETEETVTNLDTEAMAETFNSMPEDEKAGLLVLLAGAALVFFVLCIIGFLLKIFVFNPLEVGCYGFFRENAGGLGPDLGVLKSGFRKYGHTFLTLLLRDIFLILWTLLFIIPGIVKGYSYRMVPFILRDNPELTASQVITRSRKLMNGQKWNMFVFDLSYIGWFLLGCITCGLVNIFWTEPYRHNANAAIYLKLIGETEAEPEEPVEPEDVIPLSSNE